MYNYSFCVLMVLPPELLVFFIFSKLVIDKSTVAAWSFTIRSATAVLYEGRCVFACRAEVCRRHYQNIRFQCAQLHTRSLLYSFLSTHTHRHINHFMPMVGIILGIMQHTNFTTYDCVSVLICVCIYGECVESKMLALM